VSDRKLEDHPEDLRSGIIVAMVCVLGLVGAPPKLDAQAPDPREAKSAAWLKVADDPLLAAAAREELPDTGLVGRRLDASMTFAGLRALGVWYQFPIRLTLVAASCNTPNAAYMAGEGTIVLCDELHELLAPETATVDSFEHVAAALSAALAHELGHALIDQLQLPRLGREEDAADQFAVWLLFDRLYPGEPQIVASGIVALLGVLGQFSNEETPAPWVMTSTHGLSLVRMANIMCWTEGFVAPLQLTTHRPGSDVNSWDLQTRRLLSPERRAQCSEEAAEIRRAWSTLLQPWSTGGGHQGP